MLTVDTPHHLTYKSASLKKSLDKSIETTTWIDYIKINILHREKFLPIAPLTDWSRGKFKKLLIEKNRIL